MNNSVTHECIIALVLADASECTCDSERTREIARRAIEEACDNREGK